MTVLQITLPELSTTNIILFILATICILIIQWILLVIIRLFAEKVDKIPLDSVNALKFLIRFFSLILILHFAINIFKESPLPFYGLYAVIVAIISFGSLQWITNFIAGLYILITHPFGVQDFIAVDEETKGEVIEVSLNYTKIKTVNGIFHLVPNRLFLKANITNFSHKIQRRIGVNNSGERGILDLARILIEEKVVRYTFIFNAPLGDVISTKYKLQQICDIYAGVFGYKPEFFLYNLGYRMRFKFIVTTHNAEILIKNINIFRNELTSTFY